MFFSVPSLVFELSLSTKVEFNRYPPKPDPTRPMVFRDQWWFAILQRNEMGQFLVKPKPEPTRPVDTLSVGPLGFALSLLGNGH